MRALRSDDPRRTGPYLLLARLGEGGMGIVYLGRNSSGRSVAVKLIRSEHAADEEFRRRFRQEVTAARRVSGRWTPPVLDADTEGAQPWVATAYVPGPNLAEAVKQFGPLPAGTVRILGEGLAAGLMTVHGAGLVHRDLKPSNVLLSVDGPRLIDFGIARALDGSGAGATRSGAVVGSPGYMSPEQAAGHVAGTPSDVFSLGAVLAVAATGRPPFGEGGNAAALMYRVLHDQPDLDGLPDDLRKVVAACLEKDPARRPGPETIRELLLANSHATGQAGWLPPEISEAVARQATELLHLESPPVQAPPPPWPTMQATLFGPPVTTAPASAVAPRPRRRPLAATAVITAVITAGAAWAVVANSSQGESGGTANQDVPATSTGAAQSTPGDVPPGMLGAWQTTVDGATFTMTVHQGRLGNAVGVFQARAEGPTGTVTCGATLRLATTGRDRITVAGTDPTGPNDCGASLASVSLVITQESAAAISVNSTGGSTSGSSSLELIKQS